MVVERHPRVRERFALSVVLAIGQGAVAVAYLFPGFLAPARPTTTAIVVALGQIGPIWTVWFGVTGIALAGALWTDRLLHVAHVLTGSSWIGFAFALEIGAIANHGTHLLPLSSLLLGTVNLVIAGSYSRDVGRRRAE